MRHNNVDDSPTFCLKKGILITNIHKLWNDVEKSRNKVEMALGYQYLHDKDERSKKLTFPFEVYAARSTDGACLSAVRTVEGKEAPIVDAVPAECVNVTFIGCRPAEATVDLQPGRGQHCPFRVRLPPAVEPTMG